MIKDRKTNLGNSIQVSIKLCALTINNFERYINDRNLIYVSKIDVFNEL